MLLADRVRHLNKTAYGKELVMKIEMLSFLEWTLQLSILLNIFLAGLCAFLVYQERQKPALVRAGASRTERSRVGLS